MQPFKAGIAGAYYFVPDQAGPVLQGSQAAAIKPTCQLMDRADAGEHLHRCLDCASCHGTHL